MPIYRLQPREGTCTFQKITSGRKWVGRICQHADGDWLGIIGKLMVKRPTAALAFDDVVAEHLGYASGAVLRARNSRVRRGMQFVNQAADTVYREVARGNFKPLDAPAGFELALRGFTRDLRRK